MIEAFTSEIKEIAKAVSIWRPLARSQDALAADGLRNLRAAFKESSRGSQAHSAPDRAGHART